jgi:hypothetical protein
VTTPAPIVSDDGVGFDNAPDDHASSDALADRELVRAVAPNQSGDTSRVSEIAPFSEVAVDPRATLDVVALALAGEFRDVDATGAIATLDAIGAELSVAAQQTSGTPEEVAAACREVLGGAHGFIGDQARYDHPDNSMPMRSRCGCSTICSRPTNDGVIWPTHSAPPRCDWPSRSPIRNDETSSPPNCEPSKHGSTDHRRLKVITISGVMTAVRGRRSRVWRGPAAVWFPSRRLRWGGLAVSPVGLAVRQYEPRDAER